MPKHTASPERPYPYRECGLPDVWLIGITVYSCTACRSEVPIIPRMGNLHRVLTRMLIDKPGMLHGREIRYLRKYTGKTGRAFADLIRVTPQHLSRVENSRDETFGPGTDQLARLVASTTLDEKLASRVVLTPPPAASPGWQRVFELRGRDWARTAA